MELKKAQLFDINEIMEIERESFGKNIQEEKNSFLQRIETFSDGFILLKENEETVGYFCSEIWNRENVSEKSFKLNHSAADNHIPNGNCLYISSFAIKQNQRGKSVGEKFFNESVKLILNENKSIKFIILIVNENWKNAINIYEKAGFEFCFRVENFFVEDEGNLSSGIVMDISVENFLGKCHE